MKKRKLIYGFSALLMLGGLVGMTACGNSEPTPNPGPINPNPGPDDPDDPDNPSEPSFVTDFSVSLSGSDTIATNETVQIVATSNTEGVEGIFSYEVISGEDAISVNDNGTVTGLAEGDGVVEVTCLNGPETEPKTVTIHCSGESERADGAYNYVGLSYEEKLEILGKLEKYAIDQHLTGITLFENGGYVMYNPRIRRPFNQYISGYGMGILSEGEITADLGAGESNANWQRYYHSYAGTRNKYDFNYLNDTGSESSDLYGYVSSTYYGQKANASGTGYDWYPILAKTYTNPETNQTEWKPMALNENEATGLATKYRVYLKTGKDGLAYNTLSNMTSRAQFKGRGVELEDYVTPFMLLLNGNIRLARSTDYISDSSNSTLKGARAFFNASSNNGDVRELRRTFYNLVGIELPEGYDLDNPDAYQGETYIDFTFNTPVNQFTAMTNLSSTLNSPIPLDFVETLAGDLSYPAYDQATDEQRAAMFGAAMKNAYGTVTVGNERITPVDNLLSCAPYMLEACDDTFNVYKRNDQWVEFNTNYQQFDDTVSQRYKIAGIKLVYIPGAESSTTAAFEQFISANPSLDAASIPQEELRNHLTDPRTTTTEGDSTFKLNLNTCTQEEWDEIFGTGNYTCEPLMSNDNFVDAISYAINRETFAGNRGVIPSQSYFSSSYLYDPEAGLSYNATDEHAAALANYSPDTYGYNFDLAVRNFDTAIEWLVNSGRFSNGIDYDWDSSVTIDINWMNPTDNQEYGNEIVSYLNAAFQATNAYKNGFRINFNTIAGTNDYQAVYELMRKGTFDIAFGSVSGMQLDPLGFMEVLKSNNVTGFTLSRGPDTSKINVEDGNYIIYDNKMWSYDSLWDAAYKGTIVRNGDENVENPVNPTRAGSGALRVSNTTVNFGDEYGSQTFNVWNLSVRLTLDSQALAVRDMVNFKLISNMEESSEETVTVTISYEVGGKTETAVYNANYGQLFNISSAFIDREGNMTGDFADLSIYIPQVLSDNTTGGQMGNTTLDLTSSAISNITVSIYGTYYMEIGDITTATSFAVDGIQVIK